MNHSDIVQQLRTDMGNTNGEITRVSNSSAVPLPSLTIWQLPPLLVWDGMSPRPRLNPNQKMVCEKYLCTFLIDKNTAAHHLTTTTVQTWNMDCVRWHDPQLNLNQRMVCEKYFFLHSHNCSEYPRSPSDDYHHTVFSCLWCLPAPTLPKSEIFQIQNMKAWTFQIDEQSIPFLEFPEAVIDMSYKV